MEDERSKFIRAEARNLAVEVFSYRYENFHAPLSALEIIEPAVVARLLNVRYYEPVEIVALSSEIPGVALPIRFGGYMDPETNTVAVAQNLPTSVARFTAAHEFGHFALHKDKGVLFRDLPLSGDELGERHRPSIEREADLFAAELLMPESLVRPTFHQYFHRDDFQKAVPAEEIASWLSGRYPTVTPANIETRGRRYLALLLATSGPWIAEEGRPSLAEYFRVSRIAMASRLESLRLV